MKFGETTCEIEPTPLYTSATYTVVAPAQSTYPPDFLPGWDTKYPASQVVWEPNPDAPLCLLDQDIRTMDDWIRWIHDNIIDIICEWKKTPCMWMIGGAFRGIGDTLADCLKMSPTQYTIVYDKDNKLAISGEIFDSSSCQSFIADAKRCVINSIVLDAPPVVILGINKDDADQKPYWYKIALQATTKLTQKLGVNTPNNTRSAVPSGERLVPLAETQTLGTITEGNSYNSTLGSWNITQSGYYRLSYSSFVNIGYTAMGQQTSGTAIINVLAGVLVETNNGLGREEIRLFQQPFWREHGTDNTQNVKFAYTNYLKAGTKITPRVWIGFDQGTINTVQLNVQESIAQTHLNRIPDNSFG